MKKFQSIFALACLMMLLLPARPAEATVIDNISSLWVAVKIRWNCGAHTVPPGESAPLSERQKWCRDAEAYSQCANENGGSVPEVHPYCVNLSY